VINGVVIGLSLHLRLYTYRHAESIHRSEIPCHNGFTKSDLFEIKSNNHIFLNFWGENEVENVKGNILL